jgi:transcriptional regulator with XRE-family HTH domain
MTVTGAQIKAARDLLHWSRAKLSVEAQVGFAVLSAFERGSRIPSQRTLDALEETFEAAGVAFTTDGRRGPSLKEAARGAGLGDEASLPDIPDDAEPYDGAPV